MTDRFNLNPREFIARLSYEERLSLASALQTAPQPCLTPLKEQDLIKSSVWLLERARTAAPGFRNSRWRMWFIFMLLRYGGLKPSEVFNLCASDLDFDRCQIRISHKTRTREAPLPPGICRALRNAWYEWPGRLAAPAPFACDSSLVRRSLAECAAHCGLPAGSLNASALRRYRELELLSQGAHPAAVSYFLGKNPLPAPFTSEQAQNLIHKLVQGTTPVKTSARNVFRGQIKNLVNRGILIDVQLQTQLDITINATITCTSCKSLNLKPGVLVNGLVKAPWVKIGRLEDKITSDNCFEGIIEKIREDEHAREILAALPQGHLICSLTLKPLKGPVLHENSRIIVHFSAMSVILTAP